MKKNTTPSNSSRIPQLRNSGQRIHPFNVAAKRMTGASLRIDDGKPVSMSEISISSDKLTTVKFNLQNNQWASIQSNQYQCHVAKLKTRKLPPARATLGDWCSGQRHHGKDSPGLGLESGRFFLAHPPDRTNDMSSVKLFQGVTKNVTLLAEVSEGALARMRAASAR